jgi:hypothetical protein
MTNDQSVWQLQETTAQLTTDLLEATLDLQRPDLGLGSITTRASGRPVQLESARILGVRIGAGDSDSAESIDSYTRGDDVIVTCRCPTAPDIGLQVYWRVIHDEAPSTTGIEAIVSAQTDLLDSDPASVVSSQLPAGDVLTITAGVQPSFHPLAVKRDALSMGGGAVLIRLENEAVSVLEMVHPSDNRGATIERCNEDLVTSYHVLAERLEKGVIRQSRLRAMFLPRENDTTVALDLYKRFAMSSVPLTT